MAGHDPDLEKPEVRKAEEERKAEEKRKADEKARKEKKAALDKQTRDEEAAFGDTRTPEQRRNEAKQDADEQAAFGSIPIINNPIGSTVGATAGGAAGTDGKDKKPVKTNGGTIVVPPPPIPIPLWPFKGVGAKLLTAAATLGPAIIIAGILVLISPPLELSEGDKPETTNKKSNLYDSNGNYTGGRTQDELDDLANDPAHAGSNRPDDIAKGEHEREVGLDLEENGKIDGPITRDPTGDSEFIDNNGQKWDVKSFNSKFKPKKGGYTLKKSMESILDSLSKNENVILDTTNLDSAHQIELLNELLNEGLTDKIIVWP